MRKVTSLLLSLALFLSMSASCSHTGVVDNTSDPGGEQLPVEDSQTLFDVLTGAFLPMKALNGGDPLVNDSGMSGLWYSNHLHAAFDGTTEKGARYVDEMMYAADAPQQSLYFDLGSVQALGQLCIWNYQDTSDLGSCVKEIVISYSTDNQTYQTFGSFTLAQSDPEDAVAHGGCIASNLDGTGLPIDFGGLSARYLVFTPISNYGGSKYGLSEIRVFRQKTRPSDGDMIWPESFTPRLETNAENLTNGTGMSLLNGTINSGETADNDPVNMWYSPEGGPASMVILNLDGTYPLSSLKIWNYNDPNNLDAGVKQVEIFYTTGEACNIKQSETEQDYLNFDTGSWKELGTYTLEKGTGSSELSASLTVDLSNIHAQHIKIKPVNNYGGDGFGLSEIRIYASTGWAVEPARLWNGIVSTSGSFAYHGNTSADPFAMKDQGGGWVGGDGIFSTSLTDEQLPGSINEDSVTLFTFQDSFIGNFGNYRKFSADSGYFYSGGFSMGMRNMAYMFLKGNVADVRNVQFYYKLNNDLSKQNEGENILPGKYWVSDSTVIDGQVYTIGNVFNEKMGTDSKDFYLQKVDPETGCVTMDEVATRLQEGVDHDLPRGLGFEAIYEEGDYVYQYGRKDSKLIVRRTTKESYKSFTGWEYWDGSNWNTNANRCTTISECSMGNEFNVTYMPTGAFAGKYVAVFTEGSIWGTVTCAVSDSITGPFKRLREVSDAKSLFWAPERYQMYLTSYKDSRDYYVQWNYNAKAQPAISQKDELLITYHFGLHDDRVPSLGWFGGLGKEYEQPSFVNLITIS